MSTTALLRSIGIIFLVNMWIKECDQHKSKPSRYKPPKLRESSSPDSVRFYFYGNRLDEDDVREIGINNYLSLQTSGYNPRWPLAILIHGALSDSLTFPDVKVVKNEYLRNGYPLNVVMVEYGPLAESLLPTILSCLSPLVLVEGKDTTTIVAERITNFIQFLMHAGHLSGPEKVQLVGFSLGTNIAGGVGKLIQLETGRLIGRISALENPINWPSQPKLALTDAAFIDVTYTALGFRAVHKTVGHVQFFINGGRKQKNCPNFFPFAQPYCNHFNAIYYFAKSIRKRVPIVACRCDTKDCKYAPDFCADPVVYGQHTPYTSLGDYYVELT